MQASAAITERHESDAHADLEHLIAPQEAKSADSLQKVLGDPLRWLRWTVVEQNRELVATKTGDAVAIADDRAEHASDLAEQLVASRMTTRVVHDFEVIEVEVEQRMPLSLVARPRERGIEPALELATRDEACERIMARLPQLLAGAVEASRSALDLLLQQVNARCHLAYFIARMHAHSHWIDPCIRGVEVAAPQGEQRLREAGHRPLRHAGGSLRHLHHCVRQNSRQNESNADAQDRDCDEDVL